MTLVNDGTADGGGISLPELDGKEPAEQLDTLRDMLEKATRLKEGAVNFLKMELTEVVRMRVEAELDQANSRIEAIKKTIESVSSRRKKPLGARTQSPVVTKRSNDSKHSRHKDDGGDDFRTAKQQASTLLRTLLSYARHSLSPVSVSSASSSAGPPPPTTEAELEQARTETMNRLIAVLQRNVRVRFEVSMDELVAAATPALADHASTRARATAYRLLRHSLVDRDSVERLLEHSLEWYIVKSLTRDNKYATEREQVVKLLRVVVEIGAERRSAGLGHVPLAEPVMRALIAVAEHPEDPLRQICCETLVEILLIDVDLMAWTGGTRVLFQALSEGPIELVPLIATAFLYIVDAPKTRAYMHPGTDLEIALSGITDAYGKGPAHAERMRATAKVVSVILRTWSGLMYLCMDDMLSIRTMINTLRIPSLETREVILDMFFELLHIQTPEWYQTFIDGRRLTMYRRHRSLSNPPKEKETPVKASDKLKLTDQYISLLMAVLTKAGLLDALIAMLEESTLGSSLSRKATLLIGEVLQIANKVLPLGLAAKLQTIPRIFALAADYTEGEHRIVGTTALAAIDSFNRHRTRLQPAAPVRDSRQRANSVEDHVRRGQRQVEQVKIKLAMQMDDKTFQALIIETQVLLRGDYTKWSYETLLDLIEGPLLNAKRLEEAIKVSKFVKILMKFFHPFSHRFSDIKKTKANVKWIKLGCTLLTTLMANADGVRYLSMEDEFLPQIFNGSNTAPDFDPIFSKKRVEETLTSGYLDMIGTLSKQKNGLELLEKHKIFTAFYHMSELRSREDLIKGIIENIDYTNDGHPRIVLSKALTSSYKHIRLYATRHLGRLIQASPATNAWMLRLLLTQLYDPDRDVCELAVQFLEEACESQDILQIVVDMQPTLEHLGEVANSLLYKFMSTPVGFRYLYDVGFIEREMDMWLHERNFHYVVEVEVYLSRELNFNASEDFDDDSQAFDGTVPPHFYGELAKTELGCEVLREKGHFAEFAHFIRQHALESDDSEFIFKLKSVLWAVGNVATSEKGLRFLEEEEIIRNMLEIAEFSPILSVRGTCFFALGLVSSTAQGAEILDDYGWESTLSPLGSPTGLCIPSDIDKFVSIPAWEEPEPPKRVRELVPPTSQEEVDVLSAISNLANTVIANAASRSLARMKSKSEYRHIFSSPSLYYRVLYMISTQRYRLPVRRYILELFDIPLDAGVVRALVSYSNSLEDTGNAASPGQACPRLQPRASVFGRPVRGRRASESDEDESLNSEDEKEQPKPKVERPVSLLPARRVSGFDGVEQDEEGRRKESNLDMAREREEKMAALLRGRSMSMGGSGHRRSKVEHEDNNS
ncbi:Rapamycin-insensitive companion of mTOR, N-term-domain-containing protein [Phellopilus nigrolimitatus]|nr:Rapamycin-insensitive companion of mTOR, N-term-domain-containing protein [Phellopilus nigrolimitatus]